MLYAFVALFVLGLLIGVRIMLHGVERPARTVARPKAGSAQGASSSTSAAERPTSRFALDLPTAAGFAVVAGAVGYLLARFSGLIALCTATALVSVASAYFRRRLGGVTGDSFGATFQFVEIVTYATFLT